ncbi:MAG: methylenetetrahydrofolate reductase [NAD(P)H] [Verrucomicrobiota bacterium]|jgi:methylenetetrahydrofolate reductase (NADPH)|nr:methylenetetrahydrofolate reductase [NAD(P)H] [Verrucomicrobiota bacterium]
MRLIRDILKEHQLLGKPSISCEFFPAKTPEGERALLEKIVPRLIGANPSFFSVTYGAGGTTRDKTLGIVDQIQREHGVPTMAHLTCVGSTREDIGNFLEDAKSSGISNILALRGDPPPGQESFIKAEGGFEFSHELVAYVKSYERFGIGVAGFPEGHIACTEGREVDWDRLKAKVDRGADFVITQLFFDNSDFYTFRDYLQARGMKVPILAGIIPILSGRQIQRFTELCGSKLSEEISSRLNELGDDDNAVSAFGIDYATRQCEELIANGVEGVHFYTLNKSQATLEVVRNLGLGK